MNLQLTAALLKLHPPLTYRATLGIGCGEWGETRKNEEEEARHGPAG